jgi:hypothetical protein
MKLPMLGDTVKHCSIRGMWSNPCQVVAVNPTVGVFVVRSAETVSGLETVYPNKKWEKISE